MQVVQYGTNGLTFFVAGQLMDSGEDSFQDIMQAIMTLMLGYADLLHHTHHLLIEPDRCNVCKGLVDEADW